MGAKKRIGLGTFPLAGVFTEVSKKNAVRIVSFFIDAGGYYIDTAPMYGYGEVESLLGNALKNFPRDSYYVVTKCGYVGIEERKLIKSGKYEDVIKECEKSLKRLQPDYIDLYMVHSSDENTPFEETIEALIKLQDQGKIKDIGVSNVSLSELKAYNEAGKVKFVQNRFSLINRSIDSEFEDYLIANEIRLVPYQVIERGQLTKVILGEINLRSEDLRNTKPEWQPEIRKVIADWVRKKLNPIAQEANVELVQLAIAWALNQKFVGFPFVGVTNTQQLLTDLKADAFELPEDVLGKIDLAYNDLRDKIREHYGKDVHEFRGLNEKYY